MPLRIGFLAVASASFLDENGQAGRKFGGLGAGEAFLAVVPCARPELRVLAGPRATEQSHGLLAGSGVGVAQVGWCWKKTYELNQVG